MPFDYFFLCIDFRDLVFYSPGDNVRGIALSLEFFRYIHHVENRIVVANLLNHADAHDED